MKKNFYVVEKFMTPEDVNTGQEQIRKAAPGFNLTKKETAEWLERHKAIENTWLFYGSFHTLEKAEKGKEEILAREKGKVRINQARFKDPALADKTPVKDNYEII